MPTTIGDWSKLLNTQRKAETAFLGDKLEQFDRITDALKNNNVTTIANITEKKVSWMGYFNEKLRGNDSSDKLKNDLIRWRAETIKQILSNKKIMGDQKQELNDLNPNALAALVKTVEMIHSKDRYVDGLMKGIEEIAKENGLEKIVKDKFDSSKSSNEAIQEKLNNILNLELSKLNNKDTQKTLIKNANLGVEILTGAGSVVSSGHVANRMGSLAVASTTVMNITNKGIKNALKIKEGSNIKIEDIPIEDSGIESFLNEKFGSANKSNLKTPIKFYNGDRRKLINTAKLFESGLKDMAERIVGVGVQATKLPKTPEEKAEEKRILEEAQNAPESESVEVQATKRLKTPEERVEEEQILEKAKKDQLIQELENKMEERVQSFSTEMEKRVQGFGAEMEKKPNILFEELTNSIDETLNNLRKDEKKKKINKKLNRKPGNDENSIKYVDSTDSHPLQQEGEGHASKVLRDRGNSKQGGRG